MKRLTYQKLTYSILILSTTFFLGYLAGNVFTLKIDDEKSISEDIKSNDQWKFDKCKEYSAQQIQSMDDYSKLDERALEAIIRNDTNLYNSVSRDFWDSYYYRENLIIYSLMMALVNNYDYAYYEVFEIIFSIAKRAKIEKNKNIESFYMYFISKIYNKKNLPEININKTIYLNDTILHISKLKNSNYYLK